jgi:hypothetical protein
VRRSLLAVLVALLTLVAAGCHHGNGSTSTTYSTVAEQLVENLGAGKYQAVAVRFAPDLVLQLPPDRLVADWTQYEQDLGAYQGHGDASGKGHGDVTVVSVPVTMATKKGGHVLVTYRSDGAVVGLSFLPPGVKAL